MIDKKEVTNDGTVINPHPPKSSFFVKVKHFILNIWIYILTLFSRAIFRIIIFIAAIAALATGVLG